MQKLKTTFSVFFLLIFLFPFVEKELHHLSHINDLHCCIKVTHFDSQEHHCTICDFANDFSGTPVIFHFNLLIAIIKDINFLFTEDFSLQQNTFFRPLRAPPILS